ncbi:MAG: hypothetical protein M3Y82_05070 [Verrucomicrobiota bacterium]|nr:hypothetical protein [Verrucomicrobiota bacterium]
MPTQSSTNFLPALDEVLASKQDLWGLAAMRQTNGPNYEFFKKLLPPLRYVNAAFRYYPITLCAPGSVTKARLVSNGSGINARAELKTWKETGVPISFRVGKNQEMFGADLRRLDGPKYERGYLPIVQLSYTNEAAVFEQEVFASVDFKIKNSAVLLVRFNLKAGKSGKISATIDSKSPLTLIENAIRDTNNSALFFFDSQWKWNAETKTLSANLAEGKPAILVIATKPITNFTHFSLTGSSYETERNKSVFTWQSILDEGAKFEVPEPYVNDAWRSLVLQSHILRKNDAMNYSAGNAYERLYQAECGDVVRAMMMFGQKDSSRMLSPLLHYTRDKLEFHNAGFKLQLLSNFYWLTRDKKVLETLRPLWEKEIKRIVEGREKESGLFPKEQYCGDIPKPVYSLNSNSSCWRGLRDFGAVLADIGEASEAKRLTDIAAEFRDAILKAVAKSEYRDTKPPFVPIMFFGEEKPYEHLTSSMLGSYWNLLAPYIIGSGIFGPSTERERWMIDYLQEHGGIAMGMIRFDQQSGLYANKNSLDDLYGIRYTLKLLQLDEVDRALVSFYGKLAQGLTRDTFIGAEGTGLRPLDEFGRPMYLPPNSASSALFLSALRYLLIQDWDMDDNGEPETLRLLFATPKDWLRDGAKIKIENAPTAFGEISMNIHSRLSQGEVMAEIDLPKRNVPKQTLLGIRLPDEWKIISANSDGQKFAVTEKGALDISEMKGKFTVRVRVEKFKH